MKKGKKIVGLAIILLLTLAIGTILYVRVADNFKLSWNEESAGITTVAPSKVHLGLDLEAEEYKNLKVSTESGTAKVDGDTIIWDLSEESGVAKITIEYKGKKLEKSVTIAPFMIPSGLENGFTIYEDNSDDADIDYDGLTNKEEDELKTERNNSDSDNDGLNDGEEVNEHKTDPLKEDTDGDRLSDYTELQEGLNPLKKDSKGDGIKDSERTVEYTKEKENLTITATGKGNLAELTTNIEVGTGLSDKYGMIDKLYSFKTEGELEEAVVQISYTDEEILELEEESLSLYYYNVEKDEYEIVESTVNTEENVLTATLSHFSDYVVADSTKIDVEIRNNVLFVLDNSWSMYSNEQYKEITGEEYQDGGLFGALFGNNTLDAYDSKGIRFTLTRDLIKEFADSDKITFGLSEFRGDYANINKVGSDVKSIYKALEGMNGKFVTEEAGTDIDEAIRSGTDNLRDCYGERYLVLLTDGEHNGWGGIDGAIEYAESYNVKIIAIGFGGASSSKDLQTAASETGGEFYYSTDTEGLKDLFEKLQTKINSDMVDIDSDGMMDAVIVADSGFIPSRDGFNFENYVSNKEGGHCYGMAMFSHLYYQDYLNKSYKGGTPDYGWFGESSGKLYTLHPYKFTNDWLTDFGSLYEYKLTNNDLKYMTGFKYFGEEAPSVIREEKEGKFVYLKEIREEIEKVGIYDIVEIKYQGDIYENTQLNEDKLNELYADHDDTQLLNAIIHYFNNQWVTENLTNKLNIKDEIVKDLLDFGSDNSTWHLNGFSIESVSDLIVSRLKNKEAFVFNWNTPDNSYNHSVNAIRLARDLNNPTLYYLYIYDNNNPGEEGIVKYSVENGKMRMLDSENYKLKDVTISLSVSLEEDKSYFK